MKKSFVLDENILYFAVSGTNEKGEDDTKCADLITWIGQECHKIILDTKLWSIYYKDLHKASKRKPDIARLFYQFLTNSEKYNFYTEELPHLNNEELNFLPDDEVDIYMVRSVKHHKVELITCDGRLIEKVNEAREKGVLVDVKIFKNKEKFQE